MYRKASVIHLKQGVDNMDFRQIEAFVYVVRHKSFSRAADAIFLTQPTVSSHVSTLENELGVKLVDRSDKEIVPTEAGKLFYEYAVNLMNIRDNAVFTINEFSRKMEGKVEIAASTVPAEYILPRLITGFRNLHANISFSVQQFDSKQVIDEILERNYELGIVGTKFENSKLEYKIIAGDKLVLATPNNNKFASIKSGTVAFEEVQNECFIYRESGSGTRQEFERILAKNNINPGAIKIAAQFNSIAAIKQAVRQGLGVSIMSMISIDDYVKSGFIKAFDIKGFNLMRAFYLVTYKKRPLSPVNNEFMKYILTNLPLN